MFFTPLSCPANGGRSAKINTSPCGVFLHERQLAITPVYRLAHLPRDAVIRPYPACGGGGKAPPVATEDNTLSIHIDDMLQPWKGDLPGMLDRRTIRVLTTYSKTFFFIDKGTQRGATHDIFHGAGKRSE